MTPTVHVLLYGRVLCGQIHGLPKDWGPQHRWVRLEERGNATCAQCRAAAELLEAARARNFGRSEEILPPPGVDDGEVE